ncbi:MAG: TauD/TfdA dioxygenase family protein [Acidimicrobiales bacterium]
MSTAVATDRFDLTKPIGTELRGVKLNQLDEAGITEIKELVAERGVLFFREQDMTLAEQVALGRRLGELHVHPAAGAPEGFPEVLVVHTDAKSKRTAGEGWHSDVSCDERPPALSMLRVETTPSVGGDTLFASMYEAYESLSEPIRQFLTPLKAVHSGDLYRNLYEAAGAEKKFPESEHPVVRTHPVTGRKVLYVNSGFTRRIVGLGSRESRAILDMLFDHIAYSVKGQVRFRWEPNSVALWDNRCVQHHASWDYFPDTRHGYRVTTVGERPYQ